MDFTETTISTKEIYDGRIIKVKNDTVRLPDGTIAERELVLHNGGACVVALDNENNVLLVKQYRKPFDSELLEIPAGKLEKNEDPFLAGKRELREETGFIAEKFTKISETYPSPGYLNEKIHIYLAENLKFVGQDLDDGEFVEVLKVPLEKAVEMVLTNEIKDSKTQVGILTTYNLKNKGE